MHGTARPPRRGRSRFRKFIGRAGRIALMLVLVILALPPALLIALRFDAPRAFVARQLDSGLASLFRGRLRFTALERLDLGGVRVTGSVLDPAGRVVARFQSVTVRVNVPKLLVRVVQGGGLPSAIDLDEVWIPHAEVALVDEGDGTPTIAHAFDPRTSSPPAPGPSTPPPTVKVSRLRIDHVWVHGQMGSAPLVDAELKRARATLGLERAAFHVELEEARVVTRLEPYALNPEGALAGTLRVPLGPQSLTTHATFRGAVAETAVTAQVTLAGEKLSARAELPSVNERTVRRFSPELALRGSLRIEARAEGTLRELALTLNADGDAGELRSHGRLSTGPPLHLELTTTGKRWDASALVPSSPETSLDFDATVALSVTEEDVRGHYDLAVQRPRVAREALPSVTTGGELRIVSSRLSLDGSVRAEEPGLRADGTYAVRLAGEQGSVEADLRLEAKDPPRLFALAGIRARGRATARARLGFPDSVLGAVVEARLEGVERNPDRLGETHVRLELEGPAADPRIQASLLASSAHVQGRDISGLVVGVVGSVRRAHVEMSASTPRGEQVVLKTELARGVDDVVLSDTKLRFRDERGLLHLSVTRASFGSARVEVEGVALSGAGEARGSFALEGSRFRVSAQTERLDLVRLAQVAGVKTPVRRAQATLALEVAQARTLDGSIRGHLDGISYGTVDGGKARLELEGRADAWSGTVMTELVPGARLDVTLHEFHARRLAEPEIALPEGELHAAGTLDFGAMTALLAAFPAVPVEHAKGRVDLELDYRKDGVTALPTLSGRVRTHDLEVVGKRQVRSEVASRDAAIEAAPSVYRGIDFGVDLALDAAARRLTAHLGVYDDRAELLTVDAAAGPWLPGTPAAVLARLSEIPLEVRAVMPPRKLAQLPPPLRPLSLRGTVAADAAFQGSLADPHLVVDVRASRLSAAGGARVEGEVKPRLTVLGHVEYAKLGGKLAVIADAKRSRALDVELTWSGDALRAAAEEEARANLVVKARAVIDRFDLDTVPALKNRQLEGVLSGTLDLDYGPEKRAVRANLVAHPLRAGPATFDRLNVAVDAAPGHLRGAVDVDGQSGSLRASVASGLAWPARGVPSISGDTVAKLSARRFRLAGLSPVVSGQVSELDGHLDADLGARVEGSNVSLSGSGRLADGVVQIPAVGQRFEAISARIDVQPSAIVIADLRANGVTGQLQGNARIEIDEHLAFHRLDTAVVIAKNHKLPITVEGVAIGDAWGRIEAHVVNEPHHVAVRIGVPEFHLEVPETDREGVQDLGADESVRIGVRRADAVFTALPLQPLEEPSADPTPLDVSVELGSVWVKKGELVNAELTGALHIAVREEALITGRIDLKGGSLDVSGKRFEIERGTVTFTGGDPANPSVSAMARWDAPAGYAVFATYAGTARKGKLTLSAEPQLSQDEIVNLILFGTPEGSVASGSGGTAAGAVGLAGSTAARGFNRALSDLTRLDIQARVDTSTGVARPELMVPVTKRLSARVTRAIGEPSPGSSPDRTFLTLELRLKRGWALSALLGDRGASALDLVWRKHY